MKLQSAVVRLSLVASLVLGGCASAFKYTPAKDDALKDITEAEAKQRVSQNFADAYEVRKGLYDKPEARFEAKSVVMKFKGLKPGYETWDCTIPLTAESDFIAYDQGNSPNDADATRKRWVVSAVENKAICGVHFSSQDRVVNLVEALYALQKGTHMRTTVIQSGSVTDFEKMAAEYKTGKAKPEMPELAHKHQVLARTAESEKRIYDAAEHYGKALEAAPWWTEGHQRRAELLGQQGLLGEAVTEMKKYLALGPATADARKAQDQIYVWEDRMERAAKIEERKAQEAAAKKAALEAAKGGNDNKDSASSSSAAPVPMGGSR